MLIRKVRHVACRCIDAKHTVEWYQKHLGMNFVLAAWMHGRSAGQ